MSSVYTVNKGMNRPIMFKGLKAQYIGYLAGGMVGLLILFAVLYLLGVNTYVCLLVVGGSGTALVRLVARFSRHYGQYGLLKKAAKRRLPRVIRFRSSKPFIHLTKGL